MTQPQDKQLPYTLEIKNAADDKVFIFGGHVKAKDILKDNYQLFPNYLKFKLETQSLEIKNSK